MQSQPIQIRKGIFQRGGEDFLSPLLFCVAYIPLTNELNSVDCGYPVHKNERKVIHLLYTDDLKLLVRKEDELENEIKIVKASSKDVNMNFGLQICARTCLKNGWAQSKFYKGRTFEKDIKELDPREVYMFFFTVSPCIFYHNCFTHTNSCTRSKLY